MDAWDVKETHVLYKLTLIAVRGHGDFEGNQIVKKFEKQKKKINQRVKLDKLPWSIIHFVEDDRVIKVFLKIFHPSLPLGQEGEKV